MHKRGLSRWRRQMTQRADRVFPAVSRSGAVFFFYPQTILFLRDKRPKVRSWKWGAAPFGILR